MARETVALRDTASRRASLTNGGVRLMAAVVSALLASAAPDPAPTLAWLMGAAALGGLALVQDETSWWWRVPVTLELVVVSLAIPVTGGARSPLLPYLLGPAFAVGFRGGARLVAGASALLAVLLAAGLRLPEVRAEGRQYAVAAVQWLVLAVAFGLLAAWVRSLVFVAGPRAQYVQVSRLLAELRGMTRRLPGSLDPMSAAETLLDECAEVVRYDRAAVLLAGSTDRLTPLVVRGAERLDLDTTTTGTGAVAQAWAGGLAVREVGRDVRSRMASLLVVPVPAATGCSGVVVLESAEDAAFGPAAVRQVGALVAEVAPRLESALLFDEIRRIATVEERQRVAREIHDGIAQDLVYIGYALDGLGAELDAGRPSARETVRQVRQHVTKVVGELRLSIFSLRSVAEPGGLGAALGEYVRSVAAQAGIGVHLSLSEDPARLPADTEAELLRIAQEAVSNARKHSGARNLWVKLEVDPPRALLRVEDDGAGMAPDGHRGFGLEIMRERAERLGATLDVRAREPRGTTVEVTMGGSAG
ncbi:MAG TPA: sensor histidine kinase [Mycobacteriales bacterium]|jgi:signal transduction histidine kinase|nr:sensor histidine kinase [Mycobacteriales bacterium]